MPPSDYRRSRSRQATIDDSPLRQAYQQEAEATDIVAQQAKQQDLIAEQQQEIKRQATSDRQLASEAARAQKINIGHAKKQGIETEIDPTTAQETIKRHTDGTPVWQAGFMGGPKASEQGHVVDYRDPHGQRYTIPLDGINRSEDPTGAFYEFDIPGADGQPQRIRRPEETGKALFKVDKETGRRYAEAPDPVTGGMVQQPLGMDRMAANAAAITHRQQAFEKEKQARSFEADNLRLQQNVIETEFKPVKDRFTKLQADRKKFDTGTRYEQRADGIYMMSGRDEFGVPVGDSPELLVKAKSWLTERQRIDDDLTKTKGEHDPVAAKIQEMQVQRDKLALQVLQDSHRTQLEIATMQEAAKKGAQVWEPEFQRRLAELRKDPEFTKLMTEGQLADEGSPLADDVAKATRNPAVDAIGAAMGNNVGLAPDGSALGNDLAGSALDVSRQEMALTEALGSSDKTPRLPDGKPDIATAAKSLGITDHESYDIATEQGEAYPVLTHRATGEKIGYVDTQSNRLILRPDAVYGTPEGRAMALRADSTTAPVFILAGAAPFNAQQRRDYFASAMQAAETQQDEALKAVGADMAGIRRNVQEGRLSIQDGRKLLSTIHGVQPQDQSMPAVMQELERYASGSQIEGELWKGPKATPETRAQVIDRFMDRFAQRAQGDLLYDGMGLEKTRDGLKEALIKKSTAAKVGDWLVDTGKMLTGSIFGLATNVVASGAEGIAEAGTLGQYEGSERFNLAKENTVEWFHNASGFANRVLGASQELNTDLNAVRNWATGAAPGDEPPREIVEKLANTAYNTFHQFSDDEQAKARETSLINFDVLQDPVLSKHLARFMETRNGAEFTALSQLVTMDSASRKLADRVSAYVANPRAAEAADVQDRAELAGVKLTESQASLLLNASKAPMKDAKQAAAVKKQITGALGLKNADDAMLALDLFTGDVRNEQNDFVGYFRSGMQAPAQEVATEAVSTWLGFKWGQLAARGALQAAKGATVATTRRALLANIASRNVAALTEDFAKLGMYAVRFGKPLTRLQRLSNAAVAAGKGVLGDALSEGIEEGVMGIGEPGSNLQTVGEQAAQGAAAAPVMVGGMALLAMPKEMLNSRRAARDWEKTKSTYLQTINDRLSSIPGTPPFTPAEFEQAVTLFGSNAAIASDQALKAAQDAMTSNPTPEAKLQLAQAIALSQAREALAINAAIELRDIPEDQRVMFTAVAKAAMAVNEFTAPEVQALLKLAGPNKINFTAPPTSQPARQQQPGALPLPGDRMMLAPGSVPVVPAAIIAEIARAVPSLADLINGPTATPPVQAPTQQVSPVPAPVAPVTPEQKGGQAKQNSGVTANAAATTATGVVGPAQGAAEATPAEAAPVPPVTATQQAAEATPQALDSETLAKVRDVLSKNPKNAVIAVQRALRMGYARAEAAVKAAQQSEATGSTAASPAVNPQQAKGVENIARRVIGETLAKSPKLKRIIKESTDEAGYDTGGMWMRDDGTVAFHVPTLAAQLSGLAPDQIGKRVAALLDEEIRHAAQMEGARRLWESEGKPWGFETWRDAWYGDIWENHFTDEMRQKVGEAYGATLPEATWIRAMEGLRMLDQLRATGSITEAVLRHLAAVVEFLKDALKTITPVIQKEMDTLQSILAEYGYGDGEVNPAKAKKQVRKAKEKPADNKTSPETAENKENQPAISNSDGGSPDLTKSTFSDAAKEKARKAFDGLASAPSHSELRTYLEGPPVAALSGSEFASDGVPLTEKVPLWYEQHGVGTVDVPDIGQVELNKRFVKSSLAHGIGRNKASAFAAVPDVLKKGRILAKEASPHDAALTGTFVGAPITIGGEAFVAVVLIRSDKNSNHAYVHEVALTKELQTSFKTEALTTGKGARNGDAGAIRRILTSIFEVNVEDPSTLSSAPVQAQVGIPKERFAAFLDLANTLIEENVTTPEKLAAFLSEVRPDGSLQKYSQAMWDFIGIVDPKLRGTHDWAGTGQTKKEVAKPALDQREKAQATYQKFRRALLKAVRTKDYGEIVRQADAFKAYYEASQEPWPDTWSDWERYRDDAVLQLRRQEKNPQNRPSAKALDEATELEITQTARALAQAGETPKSVFNKLVDLYRRQPVLNAKTSKSKINQAYSTPAPLAYVASRMVDLTNGEVIAEPTAGNGMLLIERQDGQTILANELDPARRERLTSQGIESTGVDATTWNPSKAPDRVIANPPFGQVMAEGGSNIVYQTSAGETTSIDHAIVLKSLETMAPDGRAVFIIGGPPPTVRTEDGRADYYRRGKKGSFYSHLYQNFGVIDHFTIPGELYEKQGAGWPVDIILIQGKTASLNTLPGIKAPRIINSWEDLANELDRTDEARTQLARLTEGEMRSRVDQVAAGLRELGAVLPAQQRDSGNARSAEPSELGGNRNAGSGDGGIQQPAGPVGERADRSAVPDADTTPAGEVRSGETAKLAGPDVARDQAGSDSDRSRQPDSREVTEFQASFAPASGVNPAGLLAPVNLIEPMAKALERLKSKVGGDLVKYVHGKLGYPAGTDISKHFFGDQIDALAQAIHTAENGGALVIGDQTGTGKGRIAAGLMKYAVNRGVTAVFVTKNPDLYDAMLDDLSDIGASEVVPVVTNEIIEEKSLRDKLKAAGATNGKDVFESIAETGSLPSGANVVFTTYDQIKADDAKGITKKERSQAKRNNEAPPSSWRMAALRRLAPEAMFVLDESHLAGGQSTTGWRFGELLTTAKHAYYSSATFAKRPDNMGIYFRTNLGRVGGDIQGLMGLMQAGGVPAMQIGSSMLAQDGQYMRRERSFEGVSFQTEVTTATYERDKLLADNYTEGLRSIISVQERMSQASDIVNKVLAAYGRSVGIPAGNRARLESANFSAKLHSLVRQYLLAIKANSAARVAIQAIQQGHRGADGTVKPHKVIVAVENTMESVIKDLVDNDLPLTFNGVLQLYLNQMRRFKVGGGSYGREAQYFEVSEVPDPKYAQFDDEKLQRQMVKVGSNQEGQETVDLDSDAAMELVRRIMAGVFRDAARSLEGIDLADMPVSPIDAMRQAVERAGIRTGEMTGRSVGIDSNGEIYERSAAEVKGKLKAKDEFNNEDLDFLVINKSGSTGVSMHASEKFKNQKPRLMIVVQPNLDINEFMQTIGRVHRAGQVELPSYINLQTALPAENRPAAILGRKMAMLNANTTSNADSELSQKETVDLFNQYGDEVVHSYLARNPGLVRLLSQSWEKLIDAGVLRPLSDFQSAENGGENGYLARSVTGHLAILPVDEQEVFWETVTADYKGLIDYLDQIGKNDLRASVFDMKAETVSKQMFTEGTGDDAESVFADPSYVETVNAKIGREPLSTDESQRIATNARATAEPRQTAFLDRSQAWINAEDEAKALKARNWPDRRDDWLKDQGEQRDTIASALGMLGSFGSYTRDDGSAGQAFIEDVLLSEDKPNTPSAQLAVVRVNDSQDRLRLPLSKLKDFFTPSAITGTRREQSERDAWQRSWTHGTQQSIVTGNLLAALQNLGAQDIRGRIISYTKSDGSSHMGILLPQSYAEKVQAQKKNRIAVQSLEEFITAINDGRVVRNAERVVLVYKPKNEAYIRVDVPAARQSGGKYWRDPALNRIMRDGEFTQVGNTMRGKIQAADLGMLFEYLKNAHNETFTYSIGQKESLASAPAPEPTNDQRLKEALASMQPIWRDVLEASMNGQSIEEISTTKNLSLNAVGNILRVAQGRLKVLMDAAKDGRLRPNVQVEDSKVKASSGSPNRSLGAQPAVVAVDQRRARPEEVTHAEMQDMANRMFAIDDAAAEKLIVRWMDSGTTVLSPDGMPDGIKALLTDAQARSAAEMLMTAAAKLLVTKKTLEGGNDIQLARLIDLYRNTGTEQARALNMRFDPHQSPKERAAMFIAEALLTPPESLRNEIRRNPANKDNILAQWSIKAQEIKAQLKGMGFDIDATFAALRREQQAAENTVPSEVKVPLARASEATRALVKAVLEGRTWREAAAAAKMTLEQAREAYNIFRQTVNDAGAQAAQAARDAMLSSAPANDFASQIGMPEWTEEVNPDETAVQTEATEALKKERARNKEAGEIDLSNPVDAARAVNAIATFKSGTFDKISEFWRASILSGPQTQVVNLFSGLAFGSYEATVKKIGAGAAADIARMFGMTPDAASLSDVPAMISAVVPAVKRAFSDAIRAWKAEASFFNAYALESGQPGSAGVKADMYQPALKGPVGKIMRGISFRLMLLADEFVKSFFTRIEVVAQARQIARAEGLAGDDMAGRIVELLLPGSEAWVRSLDQALKITFQSELGTKSGAIDKIDGFANAIQKAKKGDFGGLLKGLSHFIFPFVATPTNIFKMGVTMSPLGTFLALIDGARALNQARKGNAEGAAMIYSSQRLFDDVVNQTIAWGTVFIVSELVKPGDDDDALPFITGSLPWKATKEGERAIAYRTAPPTSIRIGDRWFNYGRLDPFASSLAFIVDATKEFQKDAPLDEVWGKIGIQMLTTMQDKTFLQGFSDVMNAIQDPERFGTRWATNIATGFIPNLLRQPIRAADENIREMDQPNDMGFWEGLARRVGYSVIPQSAPPSIDIWGRDEVKGTATGSPQTDLLLRLFSPVQSRDVSTPDPLDVALLRYNLAAAKPFGVTPPERELSKTVNGVTVKASLNDEEWLDLMRKSGRAARLAIGSRFNGKDLSDDDVKLIKDAIERAQSMYREVAKRKAFLRHEE